jgi:hypothetical protein
MKVVINSCHGGFGLSEQAVKRYFEIKGQPLWIEQDEKYSSLGIIHYRLVPPEQWTKEPTGEEWFNMTLEQKHEHNELYRKQNFNDRDIARDDLVLIQVIEELGEDADGRHASLKIVEIPDDVEWQIEEYDGSEWIAEVHRTWS